MAPFVGLTGGLGAGKSEALRLLGELGAATLSTDAVVHELLATDELRDALVERFGPEVRRRRDRPLADRRARLRRRGGARLARGRCSGRGSASAWPPGAPRCRRDRVAVVEVPLLFESGMEAVFDAHDRRDRRRGAARASAPPRAATRRSPSAPARQLTQAGKGAESGLHGAQRRLAGGVEADAVPRTCQTRTDVSSHAARIARRPSRARVRRRRLTLVARRCRSLGASSAAVVDRRRPAGATRCARSRCRCATRTSSASRRPTRTSTPALIAAVIYEESRFRDQTSHAGARGLMQITPATADFIARRSGGVLFEQADLATPQINIAYGAWYLRYLIDHYDGNETLAVAAYNAGQTNVDRWVERGRRAGRVRQRPPHPVPGDARLRAERRGAARRSTATTTAASSGSSSRWRGREIAI